MIFVIFLYQRWIYPVDKSRVNEYGQSFADEDKKKAQADADAGADDDKEKTE